MDFDTSFKEDLPLLSILLSQSPLKQEPMKNGFPLQSSISKPLFQYSQDHDMNLLTPPSGSNLNTFQSFDHFFTQGSSSIEPFEIHQPKGFFKDLINSSSFSMPFQVFDYTTQNKHMHGSQIASGLWNYDNNPQAVPTQKSMKKSNMYLPLNGTLQEFRFGNSLLPTNDISYDNIIVKNSYKKKLVDQKKRGLVIRKGGKGSKKSTIKGQYWTPQEDKQLLKLVEKLGDKKWSRIAKMMEGRIGKQCRDRWHNHLRPGIRKDKWIEEEDKILIEAHKEMGNKWTEIAKRLPGRTENSIKNHWNIAKRRQLISSMKIKVNKHYSNNKTNPEGSFLQNYIRGIIKSSSSSLTSTISTSTTTDPSLEEINIKVESSDVSSGGAAPVVFDHNYEFMKSNLLEEMQAVGSGGTNTSAAGIDHDDINGLDLDLALSFEIDDQINQDMDLIEMIISQQQAGNYDLF